MKARGWWSTMLLLTGCHGLVTPGVPHTVAPVTGEVSLYEATLRVQLLPGRSVQTLPTKWDQVALTATCNKLKVQPPTRSYNTTAATVTPPAADLSFPTGSSVTLTANLYYQGILMAQGTATIANLVAGSNAIALTVAPVSGVVATAIGSGFTLYSGDGGPATAAQLNGPTKMAVDAAGNVFVADTKNHRIRRVAPSGTMTLVAGTGFSGYRGDGGAALSAQLNSPGGMAVDASGNVVFADTQNHAIRMVCMTAGTYYGLAMTPGTIYTIVGGSATTTGLGDGGPPTAAKLAAPSDVAIDGQGNLYIADTNQYRIRMVPKLGGTYFGQTMTANTIYTIAGNGSFGYAGDGAIAAAAQLQVAGLAVDASGNVFLADNSAHYVRMVVNASGTFFGAARTAGNIYTLAGSGGNTGGNPDASPSVGSFLYLPNSVAVDPKGNLFISDAGHFHVRMVPILGGSFYGQTMLATYIYTMAGSAQSGFWGGDGGPATLASFDSGQAGLAFDTNGSLYIADSQANRIQMVPLLGGTYFGQAMAAFSIHVIAGNGSLTSFSGDGGPAQQAQLSSPQGVAADAAGNVYVADTANQRIRRVTATGVINTLAGTGVAGFSGDGAAASGAQLNNPVDVAVDAAGNLYVADASNNRIRKVAAAGGISTLVGSGAGYSGDNGPASSATLSYPDGVAVDSKGNVYLSDRNNHRVRMVCQVSGVYFGQAMTAGTIYSVAGNGVQAYSGDGGIATSAALNQPRGLTVDPSGNLYIADLNNGRVRVVCQTAGSYFGQVMAKGLIYTVAGGGTAVPGDGGAATSASLSNPAGLSLDGAGNLYVADALGQRVRKVTPAGLISTLAGNGTAGFQEGVGANSLVNNPTGLMALPSGKVYFADQGNNRIRVIAP